MCGGDACLVKLSSLLGYFSRKSKIFRRNNSKFYELGMQNSQGIVFTWVQTYREIFKAVLVHL